MQRQIKDTHTIDPLSSVNHIEYKDCPINLIKQDFKNVEWMSNWSLFPDFISMG